MIVEKIGKPMNIAMLGDAVIISTKLGIYRQYGVIPVTIAE